MKIIFFAMIVALIGVSFLLSRKLKKGKDFLVPSGGIPFVIVGFTMAASQFGSSMLIGGVQQAQQQAVGQGFWPAIYTLLAASASCFLNMLVAPRFRRFGDSVTPPDFIQTRYGKSKFLRGYHAVVYICSITAVLVSQYVGFASMGVTAGFSYDFSIVLCAVVVCLLALGSGMLGVAVTDMIQYGLIVVLLLLSSVFTLEKLGSAGVHFTDLAGEAFFPTQAHVGKFFYTAWPMLIGNLFSYEYFMRFMSCKGMRAARRASMTAGIILALTALPVALFGAVANYFYQSADSTTVFGLVLKTDIPPLMRALLMITVLMAVLTSADSLLTSISGMVSRDLYGGLFHPDTPANELPQLTRVAKLTMVAVSAIAAVFALRYTEILKITFYFSPLTSGTMFAPMIVGLFWRGASRRGAILSVICGATAGLLHLSGLVTLFDRVAGPALIGTVAIVLFSLIFPDAGKLKGAQNG